MQIEDIRRHFAADKYLTATGVVIEDAGPDWCRCRLQVTAEHLNAGGVAQGGAIYTLADSAFAVACNYAHLADGTGRLTVSQSAAISYISPGLAGSTLYAEARRVGRGKRTCVFQIDVTDQAGKPVATMTGNGFTIDPK
ncbi:MAG: PaaI family thioesterase [Bifidobacteriaceae bacterium]|jgi:acyl-CoA thioesterase|nr:PaaI family thioesterase [Bifidobacteriaceae bacterium]